MVKTITLTDEHVKLLPFLFIQTEGDNKVVIDRRHLFCLGSSLIEDASFILGLRDKAIKGTEEDAEGCAFPDDVENHILELCQYIKDNLFYIESLIHFFAFKGGVVPGTYKCKDNDMIWERKDIN